jgi:hypothetical protein
MHKMKIYLFIYVSFNDAVRGCICSNELERMFNEVVVAYFERLPKHLSGQTGLNPASPKQEGEERCRLS